MEERSSVTTFLFTDIEGSTRLWEQQPERMQAALAHHDSLARDAVAAASGTVVKTTGDGIHAAFRDPLDAVRAALAFSHALADVAAMADVRLRIRCGVHLGVVENRDGDFFGSAVNRAARIMSAAHGGQILVSQATADFVRDRLPAGVTLRDLGAVRLRDLAQAEHVYQVVDPALPQTFPALRSLEATPNNLPQQMTSFIGREKEAGELARAITLSRLVTVVAMNSES